MEKSIAKIRIAINFSLMPNVQYTPKTVHIHLKNQVYNTNIFRKEYVLYPFLG